MRSAKADDVRGDLTEKRNHTSTFARWRDAAVRFLTARPPADILTEDRRRVRIATAGELIAVYASILLYIWFWQKSYPALWLAILAFIIFTHFLHHDTLRSMGLTRHELGGCARMVFSLAVVVLIGPALYVLLTGVLATRIHGSLLGRFVFYTGWCCVQQYLMQSYFHRRLMKATGAPTLSAVLVALMFGGAHVPNIPLMIVTVLGGFILAKVFQHHPNIFPLAVVQAMTGILVAVIFPPYLIHNMRVGPGYYTFRLPGSHRV